MTTQTIAGVAAKAKAITASHVIDREAWLTEACAMILDYLLELAVGSGYARPPFRVSVGWPVGSRSGRKAIAQCFARSMSTDGTNEIFVSPIIDDVPMIMETLAHELIHALLDLADGHRGRFATLARAAGLVGPLTATTADDVLANVLKGFSDTLGDYPHARLDEAQRQRQTTRMKKFWCDACGFIGYTSGKWLYQLDASDCPACAAPGLNV